LRRTNARNPRRESGGRRNLTTKPGVEVAVMVVVVVVVAVAVEVEVEVEVVVAGLDER
jgi:hypothetical protein